MMPKKIPSFKKMESLLFIHCQLSFVNCQFPFLIMVPELVEGFCCIGTILFSFYLIVNLEKKLLNWIYILLYYNKRIRVKYKVNENLLLNFISWHACFVSNDENILP